jgi:tight adherence protein B
MQGVLLAIFLGIVVLVLVTVGLGLHWYDRQRRTRVSGMLRDPQVELAAGQATVLLQEAGGDNSPITRYLAAFDFPKRWAAEMQQAAITWSVPQLLLTMFVAGLAGFVVGTRFNILIDPGISAGVLAVVFAAAPKLWIRHKRSARMSKFEEQFPEALDFMARAMRAGHAFPVTLSMLAQESPEPLRGEFLKVYNEQNLGESIPVVLLHLGDRVPLVDVRFFVSAVLMQRETGGNLGEILTKLAFVIRERFRLKGQVRAASAHGRITATILTILPIATMFLLTIIAPGYLPSMARDPDGKWLILAAVVAQGVGYAFMRKIINIKV